MRFLALILSLFSLLCSGCPGPRPRPDGGADQARPADLAEPPPADLAQVDLAEPPPCPGTKRCGVDADCASLAGHVCIGGCCAVPLTAPRTGAR